MGLGLDLTRALKSEGAARTVYDALAKLDDLASTELAFIDGVTAGTAAAGKALVLGSSSEIATITTATITTLNNTTLNVGATTGTDVASYSKTLATGAATTRLVRSELTITPATDFDGSGSGGSFVAIRGCTTLTTGKSVSDGYLYGVQGKFVGDGATIAIGSQHVAGVLAQMSGSSMTVTNGHVGVLVVSGQSLPASTDVNMIYAESGGNKINSVLQSNVACNFFLDVNNFESCGIVATPAGSVASGNLRTIKVQIDGATYYLLAAAAYGAS